VLQRSVVILVVDSTYRNKRVTFKSDVQETLVKLDTIPGAAILSDSQRKQISRNPKGEVSNRTRSKIVSIDQNIGHRTRSKVHAMSISRIQGNFFQLYNAIKFEGKSKDQDVNLQLESAECGAYQTVVLEPKLQCQLDHLRQLHTHDKIENCHDRSWECIKVLKNSEEKAAGDSIDHRCLVEWNDLNRSQSWVNFFPLFPTNPAPIMSFDRVHKLLDKFPHDAY
jgi:hypothetical protein